MSENTSEEDLITLASYPRAIAHIDCDAFFASCEQAKDPALKGRPLVTGKERGIIACASYEAKARGVTRGLRLSEARSRCPELVVLPSDYETYSIYSERVFAIIRRFTPEVEEFSIDEAYADLTGLRRLYRASYEKIARDIQEAVHHELGITVSVGLSLTKTLAKICSKHKKPNGLTAVPGYALHEFLRPLPLEKVCGFGPNTVALLNKYGVRTIREYVERPSSFAQRALGKIGIDLWRELRGIPSYPIVSRKKEKQLSLGRTKTFSPASGVRAIVKAHLMRNLESAFIALRRNSLSARSLTVYLRTRDFHDIAMTGELDRHSAATLDFTRLCGEVFERLFREGCCYRSTGVILSEITAQGVDALTLFDDPAVVKKISDISCAVDLINKRYGKYAVHLASTGPAIVAGSATSPRNEETWRKRTVLKGETRRRRLGLPLLKSGNRV